LAEIQSTRTGICSKHFQIWYYHSVAVHLR